MMAACACAFTSCDDWTDPEHIDLNYGTIDTSDPAAYEKYLANLREYRQRPHKQVYAWFNNAEIAFGSQGHRVSALPDSIDVIVINNPEKVTDQMVQDMYQARVNKGQQFSYCVSFDDIKTDYTALCEELAAKRIEYTKENGEDAEIPAELLDPDFIDYTANAPPNWPSISSRPTLSLRSSLTGNRVTMMWLSTSSVFLSTLPLMLSKSHAWCSSPTANQLPILTCSATI